MRLFFSFRNSYLHTPCCLFILVIRPLQVFVTENLISNLNSVAFASVLKLFTQFLFNKFPDVLT